MVLSCDDDEFLTEHPKSFNAPQNTFISTTGFNTAVNGLYNQFQSEYRGFVYGQYYSGTDLSLGGLKHGSYTVFEVLGDQLTSENGDCNAYWNWSYLMIANCNLILESLDLPDIAWDSPSDALDIEAETRFFRAYAYRVLAYSFAGVPIVNEVAKPFRLDYTRSSMTEVLDFIISDLTFAADNLPAEAPLVGKLVDAAAKHYLAEAYMWKKEWGTAETLLKSVTESGMYALMTERFGTNASGPGDVYNDLFLENNHNRSSGNTEGIWIKQKQYKWDQGTGYFRSWDRRCWVPYYSRVSGFLLADSLGGRGLGRMYPTDFWLNSFEAQDIRNSRFNLKRQYWYNDPAHPEFGNEYPMTAELKESGSLFAHTTKFNFGRTVDNPSLAFNDKDDYKIRLAETYLLLAEAQMEQGKLDDAAASINMVRNRSNATPVLPGEVDIDYILDERARELFGEVLRKHTLTRTGQFVNRVMMHNPVTSQTVQEFNSLWPIPQAAIDANQEAVLEQNPGY